MSQIIEITPQIAAELIPKLSDKLNSYEAQSLPISKALEQPDAFKDLQKFKKQSKELAHFQTLISLIGETLEAVKQFQGNSSLKESADEDLLELITSEENELKTKIAGNLEKIEALEMPVDPLDSGNCIVEVRAGAGGEEASLFANEMMRAYTKYAQNSGLAVEVANISYSSTGGFKEVVFFVEGEDAFKHFKFESGVHRVQRVPATEASGRIHTSTISVMVLPEPTEVEIEIKPEDIRIDVYRASGPGGQGVNTTDSAVRITHLPTQIVVTCQDQRSQLKNKEKALKILQAKLYDIELQKQAEELGALRKSAVKSADRSAKIRTYNFPQSRITDHRIKVSWHNILEVMEGDFSTITSALQQAAIQEQSGSGQATNGNSSLESDEGND